jgi:hypothetical protein
MAVSFFEKYIGKRHPRQVLMMIMLMIFSDRIQTDSHPQFQSWRKNYWHDGEFLNCITKNGRKNFTLHAARCRHFENPSLPSGKSLTKIQKVCATSRPELFQWALAQDAFVQGCDCLR